VTRFLNYFFRGLIVLAPAVITVYVFWLMFSEVDQLLGFKVPGLAIVVTVAIITLFGFLTSTVVARYFLRIADDLLKQLPLVRLVYTSTRDLLSAFVGEKRRFDRPVIVSTHADGIEKAFGFITQDSATRFGLEDHVTVYLPFSYALTGAVRVYPRAHVKLLSVDSAKLMAFVVSGGVTQISDKDEPAT
jgi:uncharacterized membrane protein